MTKKSKTIVLFGNERLATGVSTTAPTLRALIAEGYTIKAVVANFERAQSRSARDLEIAAVAAKHNIPVLLPQKLSDIAQELADLQADVGVLVAYGKIVPQAIIDLFPRGIINIHPSLLPLHRGPTPIESVILDGDTVTGVSIMQLSAAMDAGPVFGQSEIALSGDETKQALANQLLEIGGHMMVQLLPGILSGEIVAKPQDDTKATYDQLVTKADGTIDWQKPAIQLEREVRAYQEWPKSTTTIAGKQVVITKARVTSDTGQPGAWAAVDKSLVVYCGQGALEILMLKPAGKQEMTAEAFINGHKQLLNR